MSFYLYFSECEAVKDNVKTFLPLLELSDLSVRLSDSGENKSFSKGAFSWSNVPEFI